MLTTKIVKSLRLWWTYALDPAHRRVARDVRVTAMYWVEGVLSSQSMIWAVASPMPLRRHGLASNHVSFFGGNRNSGEFRRFRSNLGSGVQPEGGSCKKIPPEKTRIGILAGMKNRVLEIDIPETGKCNLACIFTEI
jgi:hypothetical protein